MWKFKLKDNREITVRLLAADDKVGLFQMFSSMSEEALEWSMAPYTMDVVQRWVTNIHNLIPLVAEHNRTIVGYASIYKFPHQRRKGVGDLLIYLHQDFHNAGLGTVMMKRLLQLAKKEKMHKIEVGVVKDNVVAIHLYENFGFRTEGVSKDSFYGRDREYHTMVHMGLQLD